MGKVIQLRTKTVQRTPSDFIQEMLDTEEVKSATSVVVAMKLADGSVATGYFLCDFGTHAELMAHVNADLIDKMILANVGDRY